MTTTALKGLNWAIPVYPAPMAAVEKRCQLLEAANVDFVRLGMSAWEFAIPARRAWLHDASRILAAHGIQVLLTLFPDGCATLAQWRDFCAAIAAEYSPCWWEIFNEPNRREAEWPAERCREWVHVASAEIHRVQPFAMVCAPALGHGTRDNIRRYLGAIDPADIQAVSLHAYERGPELIAEARKFFPDKPIILSEDGAQ